MITQFIPILATHSLTLIINGDTDNVTVTAMLKPKGVGKEHSLQISGPLAEVDAGLADTLRLAFGKIGEFTTNLTALDAQIAEAKKEKEALLKAERDAISAKNKKPAKKDDDDDDTEGDEPTIKRTLPKAAPKSPSTASGNLASLTPAASGLTTQVMDLGI